MGVLSEIQPAHRAWVERRFPKQPLEVPAAGMVEEAGELLHALLKLEQKRIWGEDPRYQDLEADLEDAIGDCAIYMVSYCNAVPMDVKTVPHRQAYLPLSPLSLAVKLVGIATDHYQQMHVSQLHAYHICLCEIAYKADIDFDRAVRNTWAKVSQR